MADQEEIRRNLELKRAEHLRLLQSTSQVERARAQVLYGTVRHLEALLAESMAPGLAASQAQGAVVLAAGAVAPPPSRLLDLGPFLDGTWSPPKPCVGGTNEIGHQMLYPGKWHTLIAPTASGKTFWALWHVAAELLRGKDVVYAHFEEALPGGTLDRLRKIAPGLTVQAIREHFRWVDCSRRFESPEAWNACITGGTALVVLDGINAACSMHNLDVMAPGTVGEYRRGFVSSVFAIAPEAAVLSLGHPPKAKGRENERHGFGSTAWLDEVDGVGFRLVPDTREKIYRGRKGYAGLFAVKDRYGEVERLGAPEVDSSTSEGWVKLGRFMVDDTTAPMRTALWPVESDSAGIPVAKPNPATVLAMAIHREHVARGKHSWEKGVELEARMTAWGVKYDKTMLPAAVTVLEDRGVIEVVMNGRSKGAVLLKTAEEDLPQVWTGIWLARGETATPRNASVTPGGFPLPDDLAGSSS